MVLGLYIGDMGFALQCLWNDTLNSGEELQYPQNTTTFYLKNIEQKRTVISGFGNSGPRWDMHKNAGVLNMLFGSQRSPSW